MKVNTLEYKPSDKEIIDKYYPQTWFFEEIKKVLETSS
jgi:hypothetical protein